MKYSVVAYRTMTLIRVFKVDKEAWSKPMKWGPWLTKRHAKKLARSLRADRCQTVDECGVVTDHGKSFRNVQIIEIPDAVNSEVQA